MYVVHPILRLGPQNLSHQVTFIKIKGYNSQQPCCRTFFLSLLLDSPMRAFPSNGDTSVKQEYSHNSSKEQTLGRARINHEPYWHWQSST